MANWNQPALTDTYANFLAYIDARLDDLAFGLDPTVTTVTNPPINSTRWNKDNNRWERFNGTSWPALSSLYAIAISGNAATATKLATARTINGTGFDGSGNITITAQTPNSLTFNNDGAGSTSFSWTGGATKTISYNTIGAPSVTGANASGTWDIGITGNAATVTNGVYTTGNQSIAGIKTFNDNLVVVANKSVSLGGGLNMFHDTANAYFDLGTGNLNLRDGANIRFTFSKTTGDFTAGGSISVGSSGQFNGSGAGLTNITTALGFTPVQQGGGAGQVNNKLYIGWDGSYLRLQVDLTSFGRVWPILITTDAARQAIAGMSGGEIGSYTMASVDVDGVAANGFVAGSSFYNGAMPGTWKNMMNRTIYSYYNESLWMRVV